MSGTGRAYLRLRSLFGISKCLATFESVEETFPKILSIAAESFPLLSAVLIEQRGDTPKITIWPTTGLSEAQIATAIARAKESFAYLAGTTHSEQVKLEAKPATTGDLHGEKFEEQPILGTPKSFLTHPLVVDHQLVLGILQLESPDILDEEDLGFSDSLANLLAVTLDRHYKTKDQNALRKLQAAENARQLVKARDEVHESTAQLLGSQVRITTLEEERAIRERFVFTLTHDLRTPLTAAKMSAQLIQLKPDSPETSLKMANRIVKSVDRVDQMITDLLDASQIQAGEKFALELNQFDLCTLVTETLEILKSIHGDRFKFDGDHQATLGWWSHSGLRRVLENLISNAIKYGSPDLPVTVSLVQNENRVQLIVHNGGEPIAPEDQSRLFLAFKRANSAKSSGKVGWGLGLTLVRGMVEAHGGTVRVESSPLSGTDFILELPRDSRPSQVA